MAAPTITTCTPSSGLTAGGTAVEIIGTGFTDATAVTFNGVNAARYAVIDATHVLAVTPAGSGTGDVVVTTAAGSGTLTDGFSHFGITCTEAEIDQKSGANVSTLFTETMKTQSLLMAESQLNTMLRYNFSDNFGGLNADVKYIVTAYTASYVAMEAISYDPDAIGRSTAISKQNVLTFIMNEAVKALKEQSKLGFVKNA